MQEGSVSLFFGSYGLLFLFLWFWFSGLPVFPGFRLACFFGSSGLPVFPGFRFARFLGASGLSVFPGLPVCPFSWVFRFARFLGVSGLPVFSGFPACFRAFRSFFGLFSLFSGFSVFFLFCIADFSVFCSVFARWLFCFVRSEGNTQIQCQNCKLLIIRYGPSGECPEMDTF